MKSNFRPSQPVFARLLAFAATGIALQATAASAAVQTDKAPVAINDHLVAAHKGSTTTRFYHRFTNQTGVAADLVRFTVTRGIGTKPQTITETGTFSPGVGIDREDTFQVGGSRMNAEAPSCVVTYVHFTDGTSWTAET
jgi:hypothetical protein